MATENPFDLSHVQGSATEQHSSQNYSSLPPYPQMIMEAIEALDDKNGCNKTTIGKHIESTQQSLPPSHATLLSYHLDQMKKSGQILLVKNNYVKPDPDAPPKRGRGRPPKSKSLLDSSVPSAAPTVDVSAAPPRSRGRPPKLRDPSEPSIQPKEKISTGSGRPRGRPPKRAKTDSEMAPKAVQASPGPVEATGERRGRGRPPKAKAAVAAVGC